MILLLLFAFVAGIVTILSPCILPILPIVLSGSITGGKKRPLGIVAGFIASFTFFTLFLASLVRLTGISADSVRSVSIVVIALFGLSFLIPAIQVSLEKLFSRLVAIVPQRKGDTTIRGDFVGGILVGLSLGLLWTPCVGPILASVISLALTGSVTTTAFFITLAYSVGTAIPLLAITYGGRQLLQKVPWLVARIGTIQKIFGILMILTAIGIYLNFDRKFQTYILETFPGYGVGLTKLEDNLTVKNELEKITKQPTTSIERGKPMLDLIEDDLNKAPEIIPGGAWFNLPTGKKDLTIVELKGSVVLVDFWTYTCINCIRTLPLLKSWHQKYSKSGLTIIGVHTPEFEFEKNPDNVKQAIRDFGILYPVMQDNDYATWRAYNNRYWPAKYLIDKNGKIRYTHFGEGAYDETEKMIQTLLEETGTSIDTTVDNPTYKIQAGTPELYLGYERMEFLQSPEEVAPDKPTQFTTPEKLPRSSFAFLGSWTVGGERAMPHKGATLVLNYEAKEVYLVMRPKKTGVQGVVRVLLDDVLVPEDQAGQDVKNGKITITTDRLYKLINLPTGGNHLLRLDFLDDNVELYAFTFG